MLLKIIAIFFSGIFKVRACFITVVVIGYLIHSLFFTSICYHYDLISKHYRVIKVIYINKIYLEVFSEKIYNSSHFY